MNNIHALIRLDWPSQAAAMTEAALALKNHALEISALIGKVNDAASNENAVRAQQEIANILALCEKARKAAKDPALEFGRRIDEAAKSFVEELKEEQLRLAILVGDFQKLEEAKRRAAEELRLAEERKLEEERRQAELAAIRAAEAEKQRLDEQQRKIAAEQAAARTKREREILAQQQAEIDRQRALADAKSHEELDRINEQSNRAAAAIASSHPGYEPVRSSGQRVIDDWEIVVNDKWALARAHPACVTITPLLSEIKALVKAGVKVAGVTATPVVKAGVSRARTPKAIEV